ncbi:MAG: DUF4912 domain-containing protein [Candidatus Jettenia sp.]|nr:DUF4912 domain-containing protein [Candidatus Jettenia sp.]
MDKEIIKEIFFLTIEVIKAVCGILWKKVKDYIRLIWNRFFGMADVSSHEEASEREWGVIHEDMWPDMQEIPSGELKKSPYRTGEKETVSAPTIPELPGIPEEKRQEQEVTGKDKPVSDYEVAYDREKEVQHVLEERKVFSPQITPELPIGYQDNQIVLMARDPSYLFTYWEIRKDVIDTVLSTLGTLARNAKMVLRVYDVTNTIFNGNNANTCFDIEIPAGAQSWYIYADKPNTSFCVDIGFLTPNGTFRILARSNIIRTPPAGVSEVIDREWMYIEELYKKAFIPTGLGISESVFERAHRNWQEMLKEAISSPANLSRT